MIISEVIAISDVGLTRENNEDLILVGEDYIQDKTHRIQNISLDSDNLPFIAAIADGMGGHACGEIASDQTLRQLNQKISKIPLTIWKSKDKILETLQNIIQEINTYIIKYSQKAPETKNMGTTLTGLVISQTKQIFLFHVGDTRLYTFTRNKLKQISIDHTLRQSMGDKIPSNILTNAIGAGDKEIYADISEITDLIQPETDIILTSDGLHDSVPEKTIERILQIDEPMENIAKTLIDSAKEHQSKDNISIAILRFE